MFDEQAEGNTLRSDKGYVKVVCPFLEILRCFPITPYVFKDADHLNCPICYSRLKDPHVLVIFDLSFSIAIGDKGF